LGVLCGVDIIEIDRVAKSIETFSDSFKNKVYTQKEIKYCEHKKAEKHKSYAARFAAKEAVSKALGTGISGGASWTDIEILTDDNGSPYVKLSGKCLEFYNRLGPKSISISLSHCNNSAVAFAVIETSH
jgi:holo-[acyl-carrier protein] synthase